MAKTAPATRKPATRILMTNPAVPKAEPVATTLGALESVWAEKGWVEHDPSKTTGEPAPAKNDGE